MGHTKAIELRGLGFEPDIGDEAPSFHSWLIKEIRHGAVDITRWAVGIVVGIDITVALVNFREKNVICHIISLYHIYYYSSLLQDCSATIC